MDLSALASELTEEQIEEMLKNVRAKKESEQNARRTSYEQLKHDTIEKLCFQAIELQITMTEFKRQALDDMDTIYDLLQEYSKRHKDGKGNFKIENDNYRITYRNRVIMDFDERAGEAKKHILDFVNTQWDADDATRDLILNLLNTQNGQLDVRDINKLYGMETRFDNENWREGLRLLKESYNEKDTKSYIQFERKMKDGSFQPIILNFPALDV